MSFVDRYFEAIDRLGSPVRQYLFPGISEDELRSRWADIGVHWEPPAEYVEWFSAQSGIDVQAKIATGGPLISRLGESFPSGIGFNTLDELTRRWQHALDVKPAFRDVEMIPFSVRYLLSDIYVLLRDPDDGQWRVHWTVIGSEAVIRDCPTRPPHPPQPPTLPELVNNFCDAVEQGRVYLNEYGALMHIDQPDERVEYPW